MTAIRTGKDIYHGCTKKGHYFWVLVKLTFIAIIAYLLLWLLIASPSECKDANNVSGVVVSGNDAATPCFKGTK